MPVSTKTAYCLRFGRGMYLPTWQVYEDSRVNAIAQEQRVLMAKLAVLDQELREIYAECADGPV